MDMATAELSLIASRTLGMRYDLQALEYLVNGLVDAYRGKGAIRSDGSDMLKAPPMDDRTRREITLRRFRMQAARAAEQTVYYRDVFGRLGLDPTHVTWDQIPQIPTTPKHAIRDHPDDFVCSSAQPIFRTTTTGTTGRPTSVYFSNYELQVSSLLSAIDNLLIGDIVPGDIYLISNSSRATLGNTVGAMNVMRVGALLVHGGQVDPALTLWNLTESYHVPGMAGRVNQVGLYPSYLGQVIEEGARLDYGPAQFGLKRIDTGGEVVSEAIRRRAQRLFGAVPFFENYGMTETWGMGGQVCTQGHLHYGPGGGVWEFLSVDTGRPAEPGELATMVCTPLPPARETTLVIRYDTQDLVRVLSEPPTCELKGVPAVSHPLGKRALAVQHDTGWTVPRQVIEALEALEQLPLPARFGFWREQGRVTVEVVTADDSAQIQRAISDSLEAHGVPLCELHLRADRSQLQHPYPLRGDLREESFRPRM